MSTNEPSALAPLEQLRVAAELLDLRAQLDAGGLKPLPQARAAWRAKQLFAKLGGVVAPHLADKTAQKPDDQEIEVTGNEFGDFPDTEDGLKALRAAVQVWLEDKLEAGVFYTCPALGPIEIRNRGIKEAVSNSPFPEKLKLIGALRQIIESATSAIYSDNTKKDRKPFVEAYYYLDRVVKMGGESIPVHVVIEQDAKGRLFYDLLIPPPQKKAMLDSSTALASGVLPDKESGRPLVWSQICPNIESGVRLNSNIDQESAFVMLDNASGLVLNMFIGHSPGGERVTAPVNLRAETVPNEPDEMATGIQVQRNGSVLVTGNAQLMADYVRQQMDGGAITQTDDGITFKKSKAHLADFIPTSREVLPSGAVIYTHGNLDGGVSIEFEGQASGVARDLVQLKKIMAAQWGPEKFAAVFGEAAGADEAQQYLDEQDAIAQRKADSVAADAEADAAPQREAEAAAARKETLDAEIAAAQAVRESENRADFDKTIGAGKVDNPIYQAYLDTLETMPTYEQGNAGFLGWAGLRRGEFEALGTRPAIDRDGWLKYLREYADAHLAERLKSPEVSPVPDALPEPDAQASIGRAPAGGVIGMNGEHYKGGTFLPNTTLPKQGTAPGGKTSSGRGFLIEPGVFGQPPEPGAKAILNSYREFIQVTDGVATVQERPDAAIEYYVDPDVAQGRAFLRAAVEAYNNGMRWYVPGSIEVTDQHREVPAVPAPEIIEYTTRKQKVLRGIIRTDLTKEQATEIDPYTWRMNGGFFIREKHLEGMAPGTGDVQPAPAPVELTPEQRAEAVATAERARQEREAQALGNQVQKLRQVADRAVSGGDATMNAERTTNTARRAGMAASSIARGAADKAAGETLHNVADAIETGAAGALSQLSSRAQLEELQKAMRLAQYETDRSLSYTERDARKGRPFDDNDMRNLVYRPPTAWANRYKAAALTLAKKAPTGNSRLIAALAKIGAGPERINLDDDKAAITRKAAAVLKTVGESWDLSDPMEALASTERLRRMGVTDLATLQEAVRHLVPHQAERAQEDPVKKAERAIIGQKVGIDFFPTPASLARRMASLAGVRQGSKVLEPSAGNGNLADAAAAAGGVVDVIEISS